MKTKEMIAQIFTGRFHQAEVTIEQIKSKLVELEEMVPLSKVIMGWALDETIYVETKRFLAERDIELYLWLPVFAEIELLREMEPTISYDGSPMISKGETFDFYCPTQPRNIENFISVYEQYFEHIPADGVFLDRIRYGSFANGTSAVLSCFCESCRREFESYGVSITDVQRLLSKKDDKAPFIPTGYSHGRYIFDDSLVSAFFEAKAQIIGKQIAKLYAYFKQSGRKVGLDTFAPFCAYFVGQDIAMLSQTADFIKPMMYRVTQAPAGLPFEFEKIVDGISQWSGENERDQVRSKLLGMYGIDNYDPACFDARFVKKQIRWMNEVADCNIYPGIEINHIAEICETTPDYIRQTIRDWGESEAEGFVLSWNVVSAPRTNIMALRDNK